MKLSAFVISAALALALSPAAAAATRIFQSDTTWYAVSKGVLAYSQFVADPEPPPPSTDLAAPASVALAPEPPDLAYARLGSMAPQRLARVGVRLGPSTACTAVASQNEAGRLGRVFTCTFPIQAVGERPPEATLPAARAPAQVAQFPARVATAKPPPAAAPARAVVPPVAKVDKAAAVAQPPPATPIEAPPPPSALATANSDKSLNAAVAAESRAVEARNAQRKADFEAAKKAVEDQSKSAAAAYATQLASHEASKREAQEKYSKDMEAWRVRVAACKAGDTSKCGE